MTARLRHTLRYTLRLGLLCLGLACQATAGSDEARTQVEQRIRLAAQLLSDSAAAQRIEGSGHTQALSHLNEGRLHHSIAEDAWRRGDLATARREVDDALRHMGMARRLVPNTALQQAAAQRRQEQLLATLERLVESWRAQAAAAAVQDGDLVAALGLIGTARSQGQAGRHIEAVFTLELAEKHVLSGMNRTLQQRELDYTQRDSTPAAVFEFELQRHQATSELLPLALSELKPRPEAVALIERYADNSRVLRGQAQQLFAAGDVAQALERIRSAMLYLQRALQAAGVITPLPTGGTP